ncbi:MAG: hypothetical protein HWE22_15840 [Flavobacteriales bacterium]|nr:hypothetical protein [Flavobacteriales bacterium]
MYLEINHSELQSVDFILKTQRQIIKDFGTANIEFPTEFQSIPYSTEQILNELSVRLRILESSDSRGFSQLLYQIDVPESLLPELTKTDDFHMHLAEVILKREAYKVYLRQQFSSNA